MSWREGHSGMQRTGAFLSLWLASNANAPTNEQQRRSCATNAALTNGAQPFCSSALTHMVHTARWCRRI
eukprot:CAMPEP_0181173492 /NCGR_PEP_ID=MMETSP1096-20121128/3030_1 /TAXON_ID=156174 ORGANISM="Chrysochromulina ericina, Strain CCMP281" /NCGR_SAMPLE_ID=MMETSP1096 /ASSEMBLY_ACC=CAM_ASM_000453 /LENGTH=68 /DNA_ID=CAMNT_0023261327 /DNA_START=229 /DNA_END=435 /DNA_ORIENTATION=-